MAPTRRYILLIVIFVLPISVALSLSSRTGVTAPNSVQLICDVDSVASPLSNNDIMIPVYLTSITDSVAGFELWINASDPSLVRWKADSTVGGVQYAKIDTVGTLTRGWQFLAARILDVNGGVLKISGTADVQGPPLHKPIPPGSGTLIKIFAQTMGALGDSICDSIKIQLLVNKPETRFSNQNAELIGCDYHWVVDTFYFNCAQMIGDSCVSWFDTLIDSTNACVIDTNKRVLLDGAIGFICCTCGDANGDGSINISDAVFLIQYIFAHGASPSPLCEGDANGDTSVNISDAVFLIQYIFAHGSIPHCP